MRKAKRQAKAAKRNWKTTISGLAMLALTGLAIWSDPAKAADPQTIGTVVGGIGLIFAKDGDKNVPKENP